MFKSYLFFLPLLGAVSPLFSSPLLPPAHRRYWRCPFCFCLPYPCTFELHLNCLIIAVYLEAIWLEVLEVKGQTVPQAFAALKMESSLWKDAVGKNKEGCSCLVLCVQVSSSHLEKPNSKSVKILHEYYFVSVLLLSHHRKKNNVYSTLSKAYVTCNVTEVHGKLTGHSP